MVSAHFSMRLYQRFNIYSDGMTEKKILMAVAKKEVIFYYKDRGCVTFRTKALGPEMVITISGDGTLVTCDLPTNIHLNKKGRRI